MPSIARGSTARSRRRQVSEDNIEEGEPSQRSRTEDVEDDDQGRDEQPRTASRKSAKRAKTGELKKGKGTKSRRKHAEEEEDEKGGEEEAVKQTIDIENFQDQPLSRADGRRIAQIADDWEQVLGNIHRSAFPLVQQVGIAMAEAGESRDGEAALKELAHMDIIMRDLLDTQAELKAHKDTLVGIANDLGLDEEISNVVRRYEQGVEDKKEAWENKTTRQKYAKDEVYANFKQGIFEVQHPDQGMPPMTELIDREEGDDEDDDDIVVGGVSQVYTCPITLRILEDPLTSQVCTHSFCKAAIEEYLGNKSVKKKCPATGCNKMVGWSDFKTNKELEQKVKAHLRRERQRQAEAESDDDGAEEIID